MFGDFRENFAEMKYSSKFENLTVTRNYSFSRVFVPTLFFKQESAVTKQSMPPNKAGHLVKCRQAHVSEKLRTKQTRASEIQLDSVIVV